MKRGAFELVRYTSWPLALARRTCRVPIVLITCLVAVSMVQLTWAFQTGLQCDELLLWRAVRLGIRDGLMTPGSSHPPLMRLLLAPLVPLQPADWMLRLPSIVFSALTILVWHRVLGHLFGDRVLRALLLPAMVLNITWLNLGFQCLPYSLFVLLVSCHCLTWFWMTARSGCRERVLFVATIVLAAWTHFHGFHVLLADQFIWLVLIAACRRFRGISTRPADCTKRSRLVRDWLLTSAAIFACLLPCLPIAWYYLKLEHGLVLIWVEDFTAYFRWAANYVFNLMTFYHVSSTFPWYALWLTAAVVLCGHALGMARRARNSDASLRDSPLVAATVTTGFYLAGYPAMLVHAWVSGDALWPRYAAAGFWLHVPLLMLLFHQLGWQHVARAGAACFAFLAAVALAGRLAEGPLSTVDYRPIVATMARNWQPGDVYLAQEIDIWTGDANFDRLWCGRYLSGRPCVTSSRIFTRRECGFVPFAMPDDPEIQRVWVYSHFIDMSWMREMPVPGWQLRGLWHRQDNYPLGLFERTRTDRQNRTPVGLIGRRIARLDLRAAE